ncbi:hypothetical protein LXL04_020073 [Taraxacum kok-saghyz]
MNCFVRSFINFHLRYGEPYNRTSVTSGVITPYFMRYPRVAITPYFMRYSRVAITPYFMRYSRVVITPYSMRYSRVAITPYFMRYSRVVITPYSMRYSRVLAIVSGDCQSHIVVEERSHITLQMYSGSLTKHGTTWELAKGGSMPLLGVRMERKRERVMRTTE